MIRSAVFGLAAGAPTLAYIGPGAGIVLVGTLMVPVLVCLAVVWAVCGWPVRLARRLSRRHIRKSTVRQVMVLGLDGLDPRRVRQMISAGELPNFAGLEKQGSLMNLGTTAPPISPVAWATFLTGVNPGKHNIFDFVRRLPGQYACAPSSVRRDSFDASFEPLRKSQPFWHLLADAGVFASVLRVPMTFPPEPFDGLLLSGMAVPDILGTQGTYLLLAEKPDNNAAHGRTVPLRRARPASQTENGIREDAARLRRISQRNDLTRTEGDWHALLPGPTIQGHEWQVPVSLHRTDADSIALRIQRDTVILKRGVLSPWTRIVFRKGMKKIAGICRLLLVSMDPVRVYVSPIQADPSQPPFPLSWPNAFSKALAARHGPFATAGLAEDTGGLEDGVLSDNDFLRQVHDIRKQQEGMFLDAMGKNRDGLCIGVFDFPDRIQHMFGGSDPAHEAVIDCYRHADRLLGSVLESTRPDAVSFVISDHGFGSFRHAVNLNAWLRQEGLLVLRKGGTGDQLDDIDWSATRAYAMGLTGVYLNRTGREPDGIVEEADAPKLKGTITAGLLSLRGSDSGNAVVRAVYDTATQYHGPYVQAAPDLVVGFEDGFRMSWRGAVGCSSEAVVSPNTRHWQADHCIDRQLVPGILATTRPVQEAHAYIHDIAPTILGLFGVTPPAYMDGKPLTLGMTGAERTT